MSTESSVEESPKLKNVSTGSDLSCSIDIKQVSDDLTGLVSSHRQCAQDATNREPSVTQDNGSISTEALYELVIESNNCVGGEQKQACSGEDDECFRRNVMFKRELGLVCHSRERLKLKDFSSEIRAAMDVEQFVYEAEIMLDMTEVSVEDIVGAMLTKAITNDRLAIGNSGIDETRALIFLPGSAMIMARTLHGVSSVVGSTSDGGSINYDQSWLCALCNSAKISRRHMIVARFKQAVNMGENAHEARLFMLIVTPNEDKATKSALETGRTFSTMLIDELFRKQLLEARNDTHFRSLMLVRAQEMSKATRLKNRHKYKMSPAVQYLSATSLRDLADGKAATKNEQLMQINHYHNRKLMNSPNEFSAEFASGESTKDGNNNVVTINSSLRKMSSDKQTAKGGLFGKDPRTSAIFELVLQSEQEEGSTCLDKIGKVKSAGGIVEGKQIVDKDTAIGACGFRMLCRHFEFGKGLCNDFKRRARYYGSDFKDGFIGPPKTVQKTVATVWFLYFGILLPTIAFSALNTKQTHGYMGDLRKAIIGQAIGGLSFALLGGQPLVIIMTTAPLCLYTKVIHQMCTDYGFHFPAMYAAVGLWNGFFLSIYSLFGFSKLMKWCTRSTEEIFALFIVIAFISDATKDLMRNFHKYYNTAACNGNQTLSESVNKALGEADTIGKNLINDTADLCRRDTSLLFILLMLGTRIVLLARSVSPNTVFPCWSVALTSDLPFWIKQSHLWPSVWLAITLYRFTKTPYLSRAKREILADYALPTAVIVVSFLGSFVFKEVFVEKFPPLADITLERAQIELLPLSGILTSLGLGFTLSLLFFMDQNISAAMVNAPQNRLKKGCAYHFDLLVVGILNGFLTMYGFPMMHGVLPHSPLHVRCLSDIEERLEEGHLLEVTTNVRETRITGIVSHILVLGSLLLIPYPIAYIPTAVLNGLFLYMAVTSLDGLQFFERILLLFTEQSKYPPNHYIRRCPQRKIHKFTMLQVLQLIVMCLFGFSPYNIIEMFFPVIILLMIPFRHKIVPKFIDDKYLDTLDGKH